MNRTLICICREINKDTGDIAVYSIDSEVTERLLFCLRIRSRANPELKYYVTFRANYEANKETIINNLRRKVITERLLAALSIEQL